MSRATPTYQEIYALELINSYFDMFGDLVVSDKPDIISKDKRFGIEVTSGLSENDEKAVVFTKHIDNRQLPIERKKKLVGWLETYDKYKDRLPAAYHDDGYLHILSDRINKKRSKVAGYEKTEQIGLFVSTEIINKPQSSLYEYIKVFESNQDVFSFLILDVRNWAYVIYIDTSTKKVFNYKNRQIEIMSIAKDKYDNPHNILFDTTSEE